MLASFINGPYILSLIRRRNFKVIARKHNCLKNWSKIWSLLSKNWVQIQIEIMSN